MIWLSERFPEMDRPYLGVSPKDTGAISCVHIHDRRFATTEKGFYCPTTEKGFYCLGPAETEAGDVIALLQGGKTPFVLRTAGEEMRLVGESCVHGIMHGEAWDEDECEEIVVI